MLRNRPKHSKFDTPWVGEVSLIDASKRFALRVDGGMLTVQALDWLSLTVGEGEAVALTGPFGWGETTALRIAVGTRNRERRPGDDGRWRPGSTAAATAAA
jgi:ABC-type multidrug transport system ATPase subunit